MATIYDVARAAGVTAATVSVALSGRGVVNSETRARILKCAAELGYRPNLVARSLTQGKTHTIGLTVSDIANPFYAEAAQAVERAARHSGFRVLFVSTDGDADLGQELLEDLAARRVDGIIAMAGGLPVEAVRSIAASGLPIVACLWEEEDTSLSPAVNVDFAAGGRLIGEHLLTLGHRYIGVIAEGMAGRSLTHHRRVAGLVEALARAGIALDEGWLELGDSSLDSGFAGAFRLLARPNPPTAIVATNDLMAMGALAAARERGVRVPQELSVVGFDDIVPAAHTAPPLTTIRVDKAALMAAATDLLLRSISGEEIGSLPPLSPTLVARASTAPPLDRPASRETEVVTADMDGFQLPIT